SLARPARRRRAHHQDALQRLYSRILRYRGAAARARHRYVADRRHRDQCLLRSSARDAMMRNFKVAMISDACAAQSDQLHTTALLGFYSNFGDVLTVDEAIAGLAARGAA